MGHVECGALSTVLQSDYAVTSYVAIIRASYKDLSN